MTKLAPLPVVSCTSSDCKNDLHCFRATQKMKKNNEKGKCRSCKADLVDWGRVHQRELSDIEHTFNALEKEMIRHHFWHVEIDQKAINHAFKKGRIGIEKATYHRIQKYIGPGDYSYDGQQTPFSGNIIFYAQHATACCCRRCVEYWHGVPYGRHLTDAEVSYFSGLCLMYIDFRLPNLPANGQKLSTLRTLKALSSI